MKAEYSLFTTIIIKVEVTKSDLSHIGQSQTQVPVLKF